MITTWAVVLWVLLPAAAFAANGALPGSMPVIGHIETVSLEGAILVDAKIDTGADASSLDADDVRYFRKSGERWVSFSVLGADRSRARFEKRVERVAKVRQASAAPQRRPVVRMGVCIGGTYRMTEVNLLDRDRMRWPMLVGRQYLDGAFRVDVSLRHTAAPACKLPAGR
jgi:hypothetical protein